MQRAIDVPTDKWIRAELLSQSRRMFASVDLSGIFGPTMRHYNRERPKTWPSAHYLLRFFGLPQNDEGWKFLLRAFGLLPPGQREIQWVAWSKERRGCQRRREPDPPRPSIPDEDESYPGLVGSLVEESVQLTPLGNGGLLRTTTSVYQLR